MFAWRESIEFYGLVVHAADLQTTDLEISMADAWDMRLVGYLFGKREFLHVNMNLPTRVILVPFGTD